MTDRAKHLPLPPGLSNFIVRTPYPLAADELELADATEMDRPVPADETMPSGIPGQTEESRRGAGTGVEYPKQAATFVRFDVATLREQAQAIADLTQRFDALELSHNFLLRGFLELRDEIRNPQPN